MFDRKIKAEPAGNASPATPPSRRGRWLGGLAILLLAGAGGAAWQWRATHPPAPPPAAAAPVPSLTVSVATTTARRVNAIIVGDGSVIPGRNW